MSRRKCALLSLVVILLGTLSLASPDGPRARIGADSKSECPECRMANPSLLGETAVLWNSLDATFTPMPIRCLSVEVAALADSPDDDPVPDTRSAPQQVQLHVLVAEVPREKLKHMGIDVSPDSQISKSGGRIEFQFSPDANVAFGKPQNADDVREVIRELKRQGLAKIIAEPTLVTFTGRPASMEVGGEFPIIIPGEQGTFSVEFREYGTRIECVPIVLGNNRIRLEVRPEISTLDFANGVLIRGFVIPGVMQRRVDTQIEMQSGETYLAAWLASRTSTKNRVSSIIEDAWCVRVAIHSCFSGLIPCLPCIPDQNLLRAMRFIAEQGEDQTDLIFMITADLVELHKPSADTANADDSELPSSRLHPVTASFDFDLSLAGAEMDAEQPHAPAILLTPLDRFPSDKDRRDLPRVRISDAHSNGGQSRRLLFGVGVDSDCGLAGNIVLHESEEVGSACRDNCCVKSDRCQSNDPRCCVQTVQAERLDADECDDEQAGECVESFITQVLQSQMQYLEGMMRARLHHAQELMEARATAESSHAKQKAEHLAEITKVRVEHMAEIVALQESIWDSERKAMADRHRDALDHEREVAELRTKHVTELQSLRIAALESEVKSLRSQIGSNPTDRVAQTPEDLNRQSGTTRRPVLVELPIHVEELTSGRVRYSPVPPKPTELDRSPQPHDSVDRVELITPPITATRPTASEIELLRHEVARLHALIEDLICLAPEAPPSPKPQSSSGEDDE
jgi:hypothetical protein